MNASELSEFMKSLLRRSRQNILNSINPARSEQNMFVRWRLSRMNVPFVISLHVEYRYNSVWTLA